MPPTQGVVATNERRLEGRPDLSAVPDAAQDPSRLPRSNGEPPRRRLEMSRRGTYRRNFSLIGNLRDAAPPSEFRRIARTSAGDAPTEVIEPPRGAAPRAPGRDRSQAIPTMTEAATRLTILQKLTQIMLCSSPPDWDRGGCAAVHGCHAAAGVPLV